MATNFKFLDYIEQLNHIIYYKYDVIVNYFDLKFKYKNLATNGDISYKLDVIGVVDAIEEKEYTIFSDVQDAMSAGQWLVRIPEILNSKSKKQNTGIASDDLNYSHLPQLQYFNGGLDYETQYIQPRTATAPGESKFIGLYETTSVSVYRGSNQANQSVPGNVIQLKTGPNGPIYIETNTSELIKQYTETSLSRTLGHPCIAISLDPNADETQKYFNIPIGVSKYKIVLTNLTSNESVTTILHGTLQDNPAYSPSTATTITTTPIIPGTTVGTLTLDVLALGGPHILANLIGMSFSSAITYIQSIGCIADITEGPDNPNSPQSRNTIYYQSPSAGQIIQSGTTISGLYFGQFHITPGVVIGPQGPI